MKKSLEERLGDELHRLRMQSERSMAGLAEEVGCADSMIARIENGERAPSLVMLFALAEALEVPAWEILKRVS